MAAKLKVTKMPIGDMFPVKYHLNIRDPNYDVSALKAQIFQDGYVKVRPIVHFKSGVFDQIVCGNMRTTSVGELHAEYPKDARWEFIECERVDDLTQAEIIDLLDDQANQTPYRKHEIIRHVFMTLDATPTLGRDALAVSKHKQLSQFLPAGASLTDTKEIASHYTGTCQNIMNAWRCPKVVQDLYLEQARTGFKWPKMREDVKALMDTFEAEVKADLTGKVSKAEPGAAFDKAFALVTTKLQGVASGDGETSTRSIGAMKKADIAAIADNTNSRIVKLARKCLLREIPDSDNALLRFATVLARDVESKVDEATWLLLSEALGVKAPVETPKPA